MIYEEPLKDDPEAVCTHLPRVQPLARRGLDLRLRGPDPHRALPHARRRRVGGGGAGVGARRRRADDRDARRRAHHRHRPAQPLRRAVRSVLGARERGRHHRRRPRRRQRAVEQRLCRRRLRRQLPRRWLRSQHQGLPHRGGDPRLPPVDDALRAPQEVPEPPDRVDRERRRVPPGPVPQAAVPGQEDRPAGSGRIRSTSSAATSGSTRSGRTTSTRSCR